MPTHTYIFTNAIFLIAEAGSLSPGHSNPSSPQADLNRMFPPEPPKKHKCSSRAEGC